MPAVAAALMRERKENPMLSDSISATREHLALYREPVSDRLIVTLQVYETLARDLECRVSHLTEMLTKPKGQEHDLS